MPKNRARSYAYIKTDRLIIQSAESVTGWVGSTDVSALVTTTDHREGTNALSFAKSGTTELFGEISFTINADQPIDLVDYLRGKLRFWINLSSLTDVASITLTIGEDATNNYEYTTADTELVTGWQEVTSDVDSPSATNGAGAAWSSINYIAIKVTFDGTGDTLTGILVDALSTLTPIQSVTQIDSIVGSGLATEAKQDTQIVAEQAIQAAVEIMDDWDDGSDHAKSTLGASLTVTGFDTIVDGDGDNSAQVGKAAAGNFYGFAVSNINAADAFIQLFDLATGSVTVGVTTPKQSYLIPAGGARDIRFDTPMAFLTAITYACTTTATGSGDPTIGLVVNLMFK